jgi:hypothetical protein
LAITSEEKEEIVASSFYPLSNMNKNLKSEESAIDGDNLEILSTNEQLNPNDEAITDVLLTSASRSIMQVNQIDPIRLSAFYNSDPNFNLDIPAIIFIKKRLKTTSENLWKWSIGVQIAYQYSIRSIDQLDGNPSAHLMNRKASEKSLDAYRLDLNAHLNYKNLYLESGISFSQITDKLSTTTIEEKTIFIDTITQVLIYKDSSTSYVQGMLEGVERIQTKHERYNRYSTIDIPIIFGYEQKFSAINWGFYLSGGILVNINFRKSGYILSPYDESLISLNELDSKGYWNDRLGMKLLVAGGIKYQWSPNLDFRFGPQFEFGGKSLTGQDSEIRQNYILMGLRAGVFFNF